MRALVVVGVVMLMGCGGIEGPAGPAGPPGPGGIVFVDRAADLSANTWISSEGFGKPRVERFAGRAALPDSARNILLNVDLCAGGGLSNPSGGSYLVFGPADEFELDERPRYLAGEPCRISSTGNVTNYESNELWVRLSEAQELTIRAIPNSASSASSSSFMLRMRVVAWSL